MSSESHDAPRAIAGRNLVLELLDPMRGEAIQTWQFNDRTTVAIGRATDNDIALDDRQVSRHHAEVNRRGPDWELISMGRHGTFMGRKVIEKVKLHEGSVVQFGPTGPKLRFRQGWTPDHEDAVITQTPPDIDERRFPGFNDTTKF